ncbi:MAG: hydrogenase maturation nickel metallochaperone HypA [Lachnospiraceae bacterium]|nr:hydrogenase maturation nickel metallochaperone HypA [Lachnospiraceae bacterium]
MHELSIVEGILEAVIPEVEKYDVSRVNEIRLKVGELSGIVPQCIDEYFRIAAKGTIAEGASIKIEKIPVSIQCSECGYEGVISPGKFRCPNCDGRDFRVVSGSEYYVDSVEAD